MIRGTKLLLIGVAALAIGCGGKTAPAPVAPATTGTTEPATTTTPPVKPGAKQSAAEAIQRAYKLCRDAANQQSVEGVVQCFSKDGTSAMVDGTRDNNPAEIRKSMTRLWKGVPDMSRKIQVLLINGKARQSAAILLETATHTGAMGQLKATGKAMGFFGVQFINWDENQLIKSNIHFFDQATVLSQLGFIKIAHRPVTRELSGPVVTVKSTGSATEAANLAKIAAMSKAVAARNVRLMFSEFTADTVFHNMAGSKDLAGIPHMHSFFTLLLTAFPDMRKLHRASFAAGDWVFVHGQWTGSNTGPSASLGLKTPSGRKLKYHTAEFYRFEDGKVKEFWFVNDRMTIINQLRLFNRPTPTPTPKPKP